MKRMVNRWMLLIFLILTGLTFNICAQESMVIHAPDVANPGENIEIIGYGAAPNEPLVLSTSSSMSVDASPDFRIAVPAHCIISTDVISIEVEPVDRLFMGWQYLADIEASSGGPIEENSLNPYYIIYPSSGMGKVAASKPYHGNLHVECWKMVLAGKGFAKKVNIKVTAKRMVQADKDGYFHTSLYVPPARMLAGVHKITVTGTTHSASAQVKVNVAKGNEPPVAYIYAPQISDNSWKVKAGIPVKLDGSYSADNDGKIVSYQWDFGDGTVARGSNVLHAFKKKGKNIVTLTVTDNKGAQDTMKACLSVI